ncbi:MAG: hypothetical protein AAGA56_27515, partial [Myxococcota bacterium]
PPPQPETTRTNSSNNNRASIRNPRICAMNRESQGVVDKGGQKWLKQAVSDGSPPPPGGPDLPPLELASQILFAAGCLLLFPRQWWAAGGALTAATLLYGVHRARGRGGRLRRRTPPSPGDHS